MNEGRKPSPAELDRYVAPPPVFIGMEITQRCNLQCPMCAHHGTQPHSVYRGTDMKLDILERMAPVLRTAHQVLLTGGGEPLLVAELPEFIEGCHKYGPDVQVWLVSNGVLLTEKKVRMLIEKRVHTIDFSLDGTIQYGHVGGGADLDKVKDNMRRLARLKREYNVDEPHIRIAFVAMRDNLCELPSLIEFAGEVGAAVYFQPLSPVAPEQRNENVFRHVDYTMRMLEICKAKALEVGVLFYPLNVAPDLSQTPRGCTAPSDQLWVSYAGAVHACCGGVTTGYNLYTPGVSVEGLWNGRVMRRLRWELDTGNYNETCGRCPILWNTIENQERAILAPGGQEQLTQRDSTSEILQTTTYARSAWGQRIGKAWKHVGQGDFHGLASEIRQFWAWQRTNSRSSL